MNNIGINTQNRFNRKSELFTTVSRKLEQVLYNHGIMFISQSRDPDGMTVWTYKRTDELEQIVSQFRESRARHAVPMKLSYVNPRIKQ